MISTAMISAAIISTAMGEAAATMGDKTMRLSENRHIFRRALPKGVGSRFRPPNDPVVPTGIMAKSTPDPFRGQHPLAAADSWTGS